jgi:glycosyltransferase involved in cell wall biosynthesis
VRRPVALLTGPRRDALSGVSTHLSLLLTSPLAEQFALIHFEVGSEGRNEGVFGRAARLVVSPFRLAAALLAHRAAIVHLNTALVVRAYWRDLAYLIVAKLCGARVLYQLHGGALPEAFCRGHSLLTAFVRSTLRLADAIVALSASEAEEFRRFVGSTRVFVVPNGVDCTAYAALARAASSPAAPLRLLYMGRLVREKGVYELVQGLALARRQGVAAELAIAGAGPEETPLRQSAVALGLDGVSFLGPVRGAAKMSALEWADVFVLPTYHLEGLPYALLESMAAGVPVIATRVGGIPELVADGINGLLMEPQAPQAIALAIRTLASDREALARMSAASRATIAARYSIGRLAAGLGRVYGELCARGLRPIARV